MQHFSVQRDYYKQSVHIWLHFVKYVHGYKCIEKVWKEI